MSYFIPGAEAQSIDWWTVDLLDACYDPMLQDMGLDGRLSLCIPDEETEGKEPLSAYSEVEAEVSQIEPSMNSTTLSGTVQSSLTRAPNDTSDDRTKRLVQCYTCGHSCGGYYADENLSSHAREAQHPAFRCNVSGCDQLFWDYKERDAHSKRPHLSGHGRVATSTLNDCVECKMTCKTKADLLRHATVFQHQPYGCQCGARFSRLDVLNRHLDSCSTEEPQYPCKYCKRHRGADGFKRRDHLMQHIRNYHHHEIEVSGDDAASSSRLKFTIPTCPHSDCPKYRGEDYRRLPYSVQRQNKPFASQSGFTKHMREEHNESTFPCDVSGCGRVGRRGYFREKDLIRHRKEQHLDADEYNVTKRDTRIQCVELGCGVWLDPSSLSWHFELHTGHSYPFHSGETIGGLE